MRSWSAWGTAATLLVVALLLLFVWPWGNRSSMELRDRYQQRGDLSRVTPGVFQTSADGRRVFFIDKDSAAFLRGTELWWIEAGGKGGFKFQNPNELGDDDAARSGKPIPAPTASA